MPRPVSENRKLLEHGCFSNSTLEIRLRDGSVFQLATTDFNLSISGYEKPFLPGLNHVGEVEENLGQATNGTSVSIANSYAGVFNVFSKLIASPLRPLELAKVRIKNFRRDNETGWRIYSHDHYFTGKIVNARLKETIMESEPVVVITRLVELDIVPDTTAAGVCMGVKTLSSANGYVFPDAADVSVIPESGGGIGTGTETTSTQAGRTTFGGLGHDREIFYNNEAYLY